MSLREVKILKEFLPYSALTVMTGCTDRPNKVPTEYEFYDRQDLSEPIETLRFQEGPLGDDVNGVTIATVIAVLLDRLRIYQRGPMACEENQQAIHRLEEALMWLRLRVERRVSRGTYGRRERR